MPERPRILIVDDDSLDRQAVIRALRREAALVEDAEAETREAESLAAAREALQQEDFDCIFLDHNLPDGTSLDLLREVQRQAAQNQDRVVPIVVLTGQQDEQTIVEVMKAGAVDFLPKDRLSSERVARALRAALLFRQAQRERQQIEREKQEALKDLSARDRAIAAASIGIVIADPRRPDCPLVYVNEAFLRLTGYPEAEALGQNCRFLQGPETDPDAMQTLREAVSEGYGCQVTLLNYRKDGTTFWNELTLSPVRDAGGTLTEFLGVQMDVTARRLAETERQVAKEARHASEVALQGSEAQLRDAQARLESALTAGGIATWTYDLSANRVVADANLARMFSVSPEDAAGGRLDAYLRAIHPGDRPRVEEAIAEAVAGRETYEAEYRVVLPDGSHRWLATRGRVERDDAGNAVSLPGVVLDITERIKRLQREQFLAALAERSREMTDPEVVIADTVRSVGEFFGVARCVFVDIDIVADVCVCHPDYRADETVPSMAGAFSIAAFGAAVVTAYAAGRSVAVEDVRADRAQVPEDAIPTYDAMGIRAHIGVPVVQSSRLVSCLGVHSAVPRRWTSAEVELLQTVVERTWLSVEVLRQQSALAHEAAQTRAAQERANSLLESIADAFYAVDAEFRFTYINRKAEAMWGRAREEFLGRYLLDALPAAAGTDSLAEQIRAMAERVPVRYETVSAITGLWVDVSVYPTADGGLSVFFRDIGERKQAEQERDRLAESNRLLLDSTGDGIYGIDPQGRFTFLNRAAAQMLGYGPDALLGRNGHAAIHHTRENGSSYRENDCPIFRSLRTGQSCHVEEDVFWRADGTSFPVAYSAAPILEDGTVRGGVVTFSDIGERKAQERERERLAERERNIAQQLQAALQPDLPGAVPGLKVARYYEAALTDEAGVGGDFYDVFAIEKGCTALVVGDLSGKGLAAAAQVSIVRNMLRAFLYSKPTLTEALNDLNRVLAENNLLSGFSTLFVGAYDAVTRRLNYVNCGQEPALVRRAATGMVEPLMPTGPILGSLENVEYDQESVSLSPGDAVALFTDGLTEVGPSRLAMIGLDGVAALLAAPVPDAAAQDAAELAEHLALALIAGVDAAAAGGVMRDDVCLLVAVVESA